MVGFFPGIGYQISCTARLLADSDTACYLVEALGVIMYALRLLVVLGAWDYDGVLLLIWRCPRITNNLRTGLALTSNHPF